MLPKGGGVSMNEVTAVFPFTLQVIGTKAVQLLFPSRDGEIPVAITRKTLRVWMNMQPDAPRYFDGGFPLWMVKKTDENTLLICFCSIRRTVFPCDVLCEDLELAISKQKRSGGHT